MHFVLNGLSIVPGGLAIFFKTPCNLRNLWHELVPGLIDEWILTQASVHARTRGKSRDSHAARSGPQNTYSGNESSVAVGAALHFPGRVHYCAGSESFLCSVNRLLRFMGVYIIASLLFPTSRACLASRLVLAGCCCRLDYDINWEPMV